MCTLNSCQGMLGLLTVVLSFWMILWSAQSAPKMHKWAKIIGGLVILKVAATLVMGMLCSGPCKKSAGCPLSSKAHSAPALLPETPDPDTVNASR